MFILQKRKLKVREFMLQTQEATQLISSNKEIHTKLFRCKAHDRLAIFIQALLPIYPLNKGCKFY